MQWWPVWVLRASGLKDSWINLLLILSSSLHPHEFRPKTAFMVVFIIVSSLSSNSHQSHNIGIIGQRLTTIGGQQPMFWGFRSQTSDIGRSLFDINIRVSDYPLVLPLLVAKHLQQRTPLVDLFFWDVRIACGVCVGSLPTSMAWRFWKSQKKMGPMKTTLYWYH